ncbi:hypothetical protein J2766_001058 [Agrobacterium tumefaciens]|uniref:Uncharacterized protein n=1 Tax=Agrobacterium tumefaciens TaxID=358 RepID=A0AAW8LQK2_AGRTU|nr:hypothetical protein [Agrobacterium tumefaciens]MDR6701636.1 hypothetical protein [Agrobacterium tumefaciens]
MKEAEASHFFHLLNLEGQALAPPPPERTYTEKLAFLAANTKGAEMTPPNADDYRRARSANIAELRRSLTSYKC